MRNDVDSTSILLQQLHDAAGTRPHFMQQALLQALALHWAIWRGNLAIARLLVEQLVDPNVKDEDGQTPLMWAGLKEDDSMVDFLVEIGA